MAKLTPYIKSGDARAQAAFYMQALGGEIRSVVTNGEVVPDATEATKDQVLHLELVAGGITFFLSDVDRESLHHGNGISLSLELATEAEAHAAFDQLAQGGTVLHALQPAFWGALYGELKDKFGVLWMITNAVPASQP